MFANAYRGKKVLVTGHTGFKGSWLCQWLQGLGAEVAGYSLGHVSQPSHFEALGLAGRMRHELGDVRDYARLKATFAGFKPDFVFHLAAQSLVRPSYDDPKGTFDTNVGGTVNVLECIRLSQSVQAAVIVASDKCYENREWEFGYRENDSLGGKDPYSASKGAAEVVFGGYVRSFFCDNGAARLASARAGNVIGGGDWAVDRIVPDIARAWSSGARVEIRNPGSTRPWQHVLEPLAAYLWLGVGLMRSAGGVVGESFNFGPAEDASRTVEKLIGEMRKSWTGEWFATQQANGNKKEATLLKLCCDRAASRLGWQPTLSFAESVRMTAQWYREYYARPAAAMALTAGQIVEYERISRERGRVWEELV